MSTRRSPEAEAGFSAKPGAAHGTEPESTLAQARHVARCMPADAAQLARVRAAVLKRAAERPLPESALHEEVLASLSTRPIADRGLPAGTIVLALVLVGLGALLGLRSYEHDTSVSSANDPASSANLNPPRRAPEPRAQGFDTISGEPTSQPTSQTTADADAQAPQPSPSQKAALTPARADVSARKKLKVRAPDTSAREPAREPSRESSLEAELSLLQRAQKAVATHPSESLALTAEHARDYPRGLFVQEREVIAIDALLGLRQTTRAEERARSFLAAYPRSPHAPRVRALLHGDDATTRRAP